MKLAEMLLGGIILFGYSSGVAPQKPVKLADTYRNVYAIRETGFATLANGHKSMRDFVYGTAFGFKEEGGKTYFITNAHVILSEVPKLPPGGTLDDLTFTLCDGVDDREYEHNVVLRPIAVDKKHDLALLVTDHDMKIYDAPRGEMHLGDDVYSVGYLGGKYKAYVRGTATSDVIINNDEPTYITEQAILPGCSGSPEYTVDSRGKSVLVGVINMTLDEAYGFSIPIKAADDLFASTMKDPMKAKANLIKEFGPYYPFLVDDQTDIIAFLRAHHEYLKPAAAK